MTVETSFNLMTSSTSSFHSALSMLDKKYFLTLVMLKEEVAKIPSPNLVQFILDQIVVRYAFKKGK